MGKGVVIGLTNVVAAKLLTDTSAEVTYDDVVSLSGAISATVNPNASNDTLFADDGPYDVASTIGQISLELNLADISIENQAFLLGHTLDANKALVRNASDVPPFVAVGFKSLKSNGSYRYTWLYKGKFTVPEQSNQTKGDSINWSTPTISGSFVKRDFDNNWEVHIDDDTVGVSSGAIETFLEAPYIPGSSYIYQAAPTGLAGVAPSVAGDDGKITGTTVAMEYNYYCFSIQRMYSN